jgi:phage terminase small subunit
MTPKQEAFVREYLIDLNATAAYKRAGYKATGHSAEASAARLLSNAEVSKAVRAAQMKAAQTAEITVEQHMADLKRIRDAAFDAEKFSAAATAEVARGKVAGFYVEKVDLTADVRGSVAYVANIPPRRA